MRTERLVRRVPPEGVDAGGAATLVKLAVGRPVLLLMNREVSCLPVVLGPDGRFVFKNALAASQLRGKTCRDGRHHVGPSLSRRPVKTSCRAHGARGCGELGKFAWELPV